MINASLKKMEHLANEIYNFISEYRDYSNWYFYNTEIPDLQTVKDLLNDEDKGQDFMDELSETFKNFLFDRNLDNPKEEKFLDTLFSIFKEYNNYISSCTKDNEIYSLTNDLIQYAKDVDPYEYKDSYTDDEHAFNEIEDSLSTTSGVHTLIERLCDDINHFVSEKDLSNSDIFDNFRNAGSLLIRLNSYSKKLELDEKQEMDM